MPMAPGTPIWLRVTLLDDALFGPFMARFLRPRAPALRLGASELLVEEVIGTAEGSPLAGYTDFAQLLARAGSSREIDLHFASPTAFSLGRLPGGKKRMGLLPEPELIFDSLLRKWNQFAAADLAHDPDLRKLVAESCMPAQYQIQTAMFQFPRYLQVGFVGRCRFQVLCEDAGYLRILNALADFALYGGVGYKTTMGMGQVRRLGGGRSDSAAPSAGPVLSDAS
jgi:CRISPR-associated endoribonuclease Cas6